MKRINPKTGNHFKYGDIRDDGQIFYAYMTKRILKNGFFGERWVSPVSIEGMKQRQTIYYDENHEKIRVRQNESFKKYYHKNSGKIKAKNKQYASENKEGRNARKAKRRAAKLQRTPAWLTDAHFAEIKEFYTIAKMFQLYTGELYHVDHIIPLQGSNVSGLHVPWNLQVLPAKENITKNNKHA